MTIVRGSRRRPTRSALAGAPVLVAANRLLVAAGGHGELRPIADVFNKETGIKVTFVELSNLAQFRNQAPRAGALA